MTENPKILIVEDNAALSRVLQFTLAKSGYDIAQASNGRIAWEMAQDDQFDLVITDQQMPEMTGIELCSRLREVSSYESVPIVLVTAKGLELELPSLCEQLNLAATFSKPFSPSAILKTVQNLLATPVDSSTDNG